MARKRMAAVRKGILWLATCAAMSLAVRAADVFPDCSWNCTAKDVELTSAYADLPGGSCEPGTLVSATVNGVFSANAARYAVWVIADVYVDGAFRTHVQDCITGSVSPPGGTYALASITWPCGSTLELRNLIVSWSATVATCSDTPTCGVRAAKCSAPSLGRIVVSTPLVVDFASTSPVCLGTSISFTSDVSGGKTPYTYAWTFGDGGTSTQANPPYTYAAAGTYTVTLTVRDSAGATDSHSYTVTVRQPPSTSETHVNVACFGNATGSIDLTVTGGTSPYAYLWSNGATTQDLAGLVSGTYSVTVTDANGCTAARSVTITQPAALTASITGQTNVGCFGDATGSVTVSGSGGTSPYTYAKDGVTFQTSGTFSGLAAGAYTITVKDANGCTATRSVTISQPAAALSLSETHVNVACSGGSTASIDLTVTGGTSPYAYLWSNGAMTQDATGLSATTYSVTVTDANGCTATRSVTIAEPVAAVALATAHVNVGCYGGSTGSIDLTVSGGTPPYSYSWSNGATTQDLLNLIAETYAVTVTDANGCTASTAVTVGQPAAALALSGTHVDVACFGGATGSIDLTVSGGTPPYTYSWSNGATSQDLSGLIAETYSVTVTDANGCTTSTSVAIAQPTAAIALSDAHVDVACFGGATGSIDLAASGGTPPYTYLWSSGATTQNLSGLAAGTYTVTVTDANGCVATRSITITQPSSALALSSTQTNVACFGAATGSIDLTVTGGTAPYAVLWSNGPTTQDLTGLGAGTYSVTVTDVNGCTASRSLTITQPASSLSLSSTHVDVACFGDASGSIDLTASGGTPPYAYAWSTGATTEDLSSLTAETYSVTVIDASGCSATRSVGISQPASALSLSSTHVDVACYGESTGSINLAVAGGTVPYTYRWSNGATTQDLSGLAAGTYTVTVVDRNGCSARLSTAVTQPTTALSLSSTHVDVACSGASSGSINLTVAGGTAPYTYAWSNGATTQDLGGLAAEVYSVTVTDARGCTAALTVTITEPTSALSISSTHVDVVCFAGATGSIDLTVAGGAAPYAYAWSNGATTQDVTGLAAGTYAVVVTDAGGCTATKSVTISQPSARLSLSDTHTNVGCYGEATGMVNLTATGGTAPYMYLWSNGATTQDLSDVGAGTYSVTVTDASGCTSTRAVSIGQPAAPLTLSTTHVDVACFGASTGSVTLTVTGGTPPYSYQWSNGATTQDLTGVGVGTYAVTVTDGHGCTAAASATVAGPASPVVASVESVVPLVVGETLALSGGPAGMASYAWVGPNGFTSSTQNPTVSTNVTLAMAGVYTLTVTNASGCRAQASTEVVVTAPPPCDVALSFTHVDVACYGGATGAVDLTVAGGTPPYTYSWSNGALTQDLTGLVAGTYIVTVTDSANCVEQLAAIISQPLATLSAGLTGQTNVVCFGAATGSATVSAAGGTPPYTYSKDGVTYQAGGTFIGLAAGVYSLRIKDANGCLATQPVTITQPAAALGTSLVLQTDVACFGSSTGRASVSGVGGTAPYTYSKDSITFQSSGTFGGLAAGEYTITVKDTNGCTAAQPVTIAQPAVALSLSDTHVDVACFGGATGSIDLTASGGTPPYSYSWSNGAVTEDLSGLPADTYSVAVTDANGCSASRAVTLVEPASALALGDSHLDVVCSGAATGAIDLTVSGGTAPYSYSWSNGALTEDLAGLGAGTYVVTVTDSGGCVASRSVAVAQPTVLLEAVILAPVASLAPGGTLSFVGGPAGMASYSWAGPNGFTSSDQNPIVSTSFTAAMAGTYTLTVTDGAGCSAQASVNIAVTAGAGGGCVQGIVISEIAWAGTAADPEAEWIELRNLLDTDIDLAGWSLRWRLAKPETPEDNAWKVLPLSGTVGAAESRELLQLRPYSSDPDDLWLDLRDQRRGRDFYLIERLSDETIPDVAADLVYDALPVEERRLGLSDEGEILQLVDPTGCVVDTANIERDDIGGWVAGDEETSATMERTDPAERDLETNWHENLGIITYGVDAAGTSLYGTPGVPNEPLFESGLEETETTTLVLAAEGIVAPLPATGFTNNGDPTRIVTLAEGSDVPAPATFHVTLEPESVALRLTNTPPSGPYEVWTRIGDTVLLFHVQVQ